MNVIAGLLHLVICRAGAAAVAAARGVWEVDNDTLC